MDPIVLAAAKQYVAALGAAEESCLPHSALPSWETMSPAAQQVLLAAMRKALIAGITVAQERGLAWLLKIQTELV